MKIKITAILIVIIVLSSCVTIPKETVTLSKTLGKDLEILHRSHRYSVQIYYGKIQDDINYFINEIYAPFAINYVLKDELKNYQKGDSSIFKTLDLAGKKEGMEESENVLKEITDFISAAQQQIDSKRNELLQPVTKQENVLLSSIDQAYESTIYANSTITRYLESIRKVKETQLEAQAMIGLAGADTLVINTMVRLSEMIEKAVEEGEKIDMKSDEAYDKLEAIVNKIKGLTSNN